MGWEWVAFVHGLIQVSSFLVPSCAPEPRARGRIGHGEANVAKSIHRAFRAFTINSIKLNEKCSKDFSFQNFQIQTREIIVFFSPSQFPVLLQIYSIKNFRILPKIKRLNADNLNSFSKFFLFMMIKYTNYFLEVIYHSKLIYFTELASETV